MLDKFFKTQEYYKDQIKFYKTIESKKANLCDYPNIEPQLVEILKSKGLTKLYYHQKEAFELVEKGKNIIVTTPTASGKTLCFNLPVLNSLLKDPKATYLYLYPTKALTEDQYNRLISYNIKPHKIFTYDGDTPKDSRAYIRRRGGVIFTNPDMLHLGILSSNRMWESYFHNLKYVVIDEFHHYKGTFASHFSAIIRRLRRICAYYGSNPTFILSSATLSNPQEFAHNMTGLDFQLIDENGAPKGEQNIIFWNPPVSQIKDEGRIIQSLRNSPREAFNVTLSLVKQNKKVIVFPRSRKNVELLTKKLRETLGSKYNILSYRSGYTPQERREIERKLFNGEINVVVATNALELGIDIGALDAVVTVGYPGSISSLWQQFGRSGRKENQGTGIFIARDDLIDQYYMNKPQEFFNKSLDKSVVNNENEYILFNQIACAVAELPMTMDELKLYFSPKALKVMGDLVINDLVKYNDHFYWAVKESPHTITNIRGTGATEFEIYENSKLIGLCDMAHLYSTLHKGAIYIHDGETYEVIKLDEEYKKAYIKKVDVDYYTNVHENIQISDVQREITYKSPRMEFNFASCHVTTSMPNYDLKKFKNGKVIEKKALDVPDTELSTQCVAFTIDPKYVNRLKQENIPLDGSVHALEHILIGVAPILINCDRNDLGGVSYSFYPETGEATVFIYDGYEGGIGITKALFDMKNDWVQLAFDTICNCKCDKGCPSCIQSPKCGNNNQPLNKEGAKILLDCILNEFNY